MHFYCKVGKVAPSVELLFSRLHSSTIARNIQLEFLQAHPNTELTEQKHGREKMTRNTEGGG